MSMRIVEEDILEPSKRSLIIKDILGAENVQRKREAKRRTEIYKDNTRRYVLEQLRKELDADTVKEMETRIANISLLKKIINKKARVYSLAPVRKTENEAATEQLKKLVDCFKLNSVMKKVNRYTELHRNSAVYIVPYLDKATNKWEVFLRVLDPSMFDVIEDMDNPEEGIVYIYSYFNENSAPTASLTPNHLSEGANGFRAGDNINQSIADAPADQSNCYYVWWSSKYHFTTDTKGEIIKGVSPDDFKNPIGMIPFVDFHKNQDGAYWSQGGDDLIDGSILINQILTDLYFIAKVQGMGIFYLFGKGVAKSYKLGPNHAITMDIDEKDPTPQIGFASSNPPIDAFMRMVEQYVALLLSTNDLEPNSIAGQLTTANASSGIQEMIRSSEVTSAIEDDQEQYIDKEKDIIEIIAAWMNLYLDKRIASEELVEIGKIKNAEDYSLHFQKPAQFTSEKEKLEVIEKRVDMGLDTQLDALMRDNPDMGVDEAKAKLLEIQREKLEKASFKMVKDTKQLEDSPEDENATNDNAEDNLDEMSNGNQEE